MEVLGNPRDRRAAVAGGIVLVVVAIVYPIVADATARPLSVFVLPSLLAAVLGGWRPTLLVGGAGLIVAIFIGLVGPLDTTALVARWAIVLVGTVMGALGAAVREAQSDRLASLHEAVALRAAFERALAPAPIAPPGFRAVSRYQPAESRMHLGGDFLEGIALADGRFAVVIGDVCGHGPREAAFGSALRAGWKAIALGNGGDPVDWVQSLDDAFFRDGRIDTYVTMCTGWIDREMGRMRLVTLGHPPPVMLGSSPRELSVQPAPPLGLGHHGGWVATEHEWPGAPVLFYSDGLVENPGRGDGSDRWGIEGLLCWLATRPQHGDLTQVADDLVTVASRERQRRDDVALLLVAEASADRPLTPAPGSGSGLLPG
jgi:serine phosphatase RsbU (regulator of sigma subunit)